MDRLDWDAWPDLEAVPAPGHIDARACAVGARSRLFAASTADHADAWVRALAPTAPSASLYATDHRIARTFAQVSGVRVPGLLGVFERRLWLDRIPWVPLATPRADAVDRFVESALTTALTDGTVVAFGEPHVDADGYLVIEDCGVVAHLEADERALVADTLKALTDADPAAAAAAVHRLTGAPEPLLLDTARKACAALVVGWSPAAVGLSLHQLACRADHLGAAGGFWLFADELLHRLDLWHEHPSGTRVLADPEATRRLLTTTMA